MVTLPVALPGTTTTTVPLPLSMTVMSSSVMLTLDTLNVVELVLVMYLPSPLYSTFTVYVPTSKPLTTRIPVPLDTETV